MNTQEIHDLTAVVALCRSAVLEWLLKNPGEFLVQRVFNEVLVRVLHHGEVIEKSIDHALVAAAMKVAENKPIAHCTVTDVNPDEKSVTIRVEPA